MFKRNEGYALNYVLVVLLVLCIIATSVMAPPLRNLQMQQASIERMQEKYVVQGMIEQVVAQLDGVTSLPTGDALKNNIQIPEGFGCEIMLNSTTYTITAKNSSVTIRTEILLTPKTNDAEIPEIIGYTISYNSYDISYNTGGAE